MITLTLKIENVYEDGDTVVTRETATIPPPPSDDEDELQEWAEEHIFPLTGTGREGGDAAYFVEVTASSEPALVGHEFEWGT